MQGDTEVLVEVNLAGEEGKGGVDPADLDEFIERCPVRVVGPDDDAALQPRTRRPPGRISRASRELAGDRGLERLSMGTSQDWRVAVEEGATIIRLGTSLWV